MHVILGPVVLISGRFLSFTAFLVNVSPSSKFLV